MCLLEIKTVSISKTENGLNISLNSFFPHFVQSLCFFSITILFIAVLQSLQMLASLELFPHFVQINSSPAISNSMLLLQFVHIFSVSFSMFLPIFSAISFNEQRSKILSLKCPLIMLFR